MAITLRSQKLKNKPENLYKKMKQKVGLQSGWNGLMQKKFHSLKLTLALKDDDERPFHHLFDC